MVSLAAAPVLFKKELESQEATEGEQATLCCETSSPDCKVTWLKGSTMLTHGEKYSLEQRTTTHILIIHKLNVKDSGEYTCDTGDKRSTASLKVKGKRAQLLICSCSSWSSQSYMVLTSTGLYLLLCICFVSCLTVGDIDLVGHSFFYSTLVFIDICTESLHYRYGE